MQYRFIDKLLIPLNTFLNKTKVYKPIAYNTVQVRRSISKTLGIFCGLLFLSEAKKKKPKEAPP
ncbi:hypothetical protein Q787_09825 [Ornithobacterium rhinotracheale H06-030791]|uniref:Uncharacterized protein n=1 Tax=Ornithobacterium rhinotracheale (strain ATCC 51463 / DSM 15997 / CCUG 23171 / CIP 104009 / LMG 9086) TaxID=867902 RepID=I4A2H3_ORNRL|nr:hypothetical protein Ornrh_2022 [Ornithobacterium rhinotracheale DSM 15997]AIQ00694.1 hypothetical protein Q785_09995 [Ornithobacterium rhinotracheale ORT-UMN 88]KGB66349.1 hypothetical protein Q787_09825 [Ornithobacterium rhinotracheale H06-030791]